MAQLTIDIPDELAQRLVPYQNQISEIFARLINTSLLNESTSRTELVSNPVIAQLKTNKDLRGFKATRIDSKVDKPCLLPVLTIERIIANKSRPQLERNPFVIFLNMTLQRGCN